VTTVADEKAVVTLLNPLGQVVSRKEIMTTGGATTKALVETANLPAGVYTWTVHTGHAATSGKITIVH
jgi:hypothetical protein